jgi:hypothetical protein
MSDELTQSFRDKVAGIKPLNKRQLAKDIGVDYDRMSKWLGANINIKDVADREAVENWVNGTSKNISKNISANGNDYKDKYIALLEKQAERDKTELEKVNERLTALETNLSVVLRMQQWIYATLQGSQEEILNHLLKTDQARKAAATSSHSRAYSYLKKVQKEGIPSDESK